MHLMKEDVMLYIQRVAYRTPNLHDDHPEVRAEIGLARRILDRMGVPYLKEEDDDQTKAQMASS